MLSSSARLGLLNSQIVPNQLKRTFTTKTMDKAKEAAGILGWADKKTGAFNRQTSVFRNFISKDPNAQFPAEKGRYHLYVSYACPWGKAIPS
jgi:putative glutathione S-transferase